MIRMDDMVRPIKLLHELGDLAITLRQVISVTVFGGKHNQITLLKQWVGGTVTVGSSCL